MPVYYFHPTLIPKRAKQPLLARMAYHAGEKLTDQTTGKMYGTETTSCTLKKQAIWLPTPAPDTLQSRENLWNAVNTLDVPKNVDLILRLQIILPFELTVEVNWQLARRYIARSFLRHQLAADAVLRLLPVGYHTQPMLVVMLPLLTIDTEGLHDVSVNLHRCRFMTRCRLCWVRYANQALKRQGFKPLQEHHPLIAQQMECVNT